MDSRPRCYAVTHTAAHSPHRGTLPHPVVKHPAATHSAVRPLVRIGTSCAAQPGRLLWPLRCVRPLRCAHLRHVLVCPAASSSWLRRDADTDGMSETACRLPARAAPRRGRDAPCQTYSTLHACSLHRAAVARSQPLARRVSRGPHTRARHLTKKHISMSPATAGPCQPARNLALLFGDVAAH